MGNFTGCSTCFDGNMTAATKIAEDSNFAACKGCTSSVLEVACPCVMHSLQPSFTSSALR